MSRARAGGSEFEAALEMLPTGRVSLNPDCGFSPSSINPMDLDEAYSSSGRCQGARCCASGHDKGSRFRTPMAY